MILVTRRETKQEEVGVIIRVNKIKAQMVLLGVTQQELAKNLGITQKTLSNKLHGKSEFTISEAKVLIDKLRITDPSEIFFDHGVTL